MEECNYKEKNYELIKLYKDGNKDVLNELLQLNDKLVSKIINKKFHWRYGSCFNYDDLKQEGYLALLTAVDKFDLNKGMAFGTYASYWIVQGIGRYIHNNGRFIRIPVYLFEKIDKFYFVFNNLNNELGRKPTNIEIATAMEISVDEANTLIYYSKDNIRSLSQTILGTEDLNVEDSIADKEFIIDEKLLDGELKEEFNKVIRSNLTVKEERALKLRFSLDYDVMKFPDIGRQLGVSHQRASQLCSSALRKLKINLSGYFND